jgi:hypothetical protein
MRQWCPSPFAGESRHSVTVTMVLVTVPLLRRRPLAKRGSLRKHIILVEKLPRPSPAASNATSMGDCHRAAPLPVYCGPRVRLADCKRRAAPASPNIA